MTAFEGYLIDDAGLTDQATEVPEAVDQFTDKAALLLL